MSTNYLFTFNQMQVLVFQYHSSLNIADIMLNTKQSINQSDKSEHALHLSPISHSLCLVYAQCHY